jgi:uncharacterized protein involved in cysteine biosynthesis
MRHLLKGFEIVMNDRRLRAVVWKPLIYSAVLFFLTFTIGWFLLVPRVSRWGTALGLYAGVANILSVLGYIVIWWLCAGMLYLTISGFLSSLLWDDLSGKVEESRTGQSSHVPLPFATLMADAILRLVFSSLICVATLASGCLSFGVLGVVFAGWLGLYDYSACAFLRKGIPFSSQFSRVFRCEGWMGFALVSGVVSLVPIVNVLAMPALVAGGTLLCLSSETKQKL